MWHEVTTTTKMATDHKRQTWQQMNDEGTKRKDRRYKCKSELVKIKEKVYITVSVYSA